MQDLVTYLVSQIVTNPAAVIVEENRQEGMVDLSLKVDDQDMGLIIGKKGQTIKALRKLLTVRAMAENVRVNLHLVDQAASDESLESRVEDKTISH